MKTLSKYLRVAAGFFVLYFGISPVYAQTDNTKKVLPEFTSIVVSSPVDFTLSQGSESSISVKDGNIDDLKAEVTEGTLYIKGKPSDDVVISFSKLNKLELQSTCDVKTTGLITSDKLEVYLKGAASDLELNVNINELVTLIEGAGDIKYTGTADSHSLTIKGAGDVNAYGLETNTTNVEINGAGDAKLNAKQDLKGTINGAGDITYLNEPVTKDIKVNGVGSYGLKGSEKNSQVGNAEQKYDTIKFNLGDYDVYMVKDLKGVNGLEKPKRDTVKDNFNIYWAGIGLGVNGYLNSSNEPKTPTGYDFLDLNYRKSINFSLNFWEQKIPLWKKHINIVTGMGFDISNYRFSSKNERLAQDTNYISAIYDTTVAYKKNKLVATYLNVPLLLQFDSNPFGKHDKTVHISAGVIGSVRLGSHEKQVYEINGSNFNPKTRDDFNLNPFRYSAMVRVGVGKIDLYASYALNTMFKKNEGPQVNPFTVGLTLVGF